MNKENGKSKPRSARRSCKLADFETLEKKLEERDVRIADIGLLAGGVTELLMPSEGCIGQSEIDKATDLAIIKLDAIQALVRGEDLGEWAKKKVGLI